MSVPHEFLWGVATSSYQVEGFPLADGGGPCIWHDFSHTPGTTEAGDTGDIACDHYHRFREDVALMKELGVGAYRLSLRWPRVLPLGVGRSNEAGWDFYDRLIDEVLEAGIRPFVTLYHWDLPSALQDRGGWLSPEVPDWFAEYADQVAARLGDRVRHIITLNEPWVTAIAGHVMGRMAPGIRSMAAGMRAVKAQILAHDAAYQAIKARSGDIQVGLTLSNGWHRPESDTDADRAAAARAHAYFNFPLFLDPILRGTLPAEIEADLAPHLTADDLFAAGRPQVTTLDFVGLNYYESMRVTADPGQPLGYRKVEPSERPTTAMGWTVDADGMYALLMSLKERYGDVPVYITENGAAFDDVPSDDGVHDPERTAYLNDHIAAVLSARRAGADVRGYFLWSLMDNYEWAYGYAKRFGIVYVDRDHLSRTLKDSGRWYGEVCRGERVPAAS